MVEVRSRRILIGGEPVVVMAGEVHYFRVARDEWEDRIRSAKEVGCTAVASYIPWLWHELPDGTIDVTGRDPPGTGRRARSSTSAASTACGSSPGPGRSSWPS